jgi:hypothetical protein
MAQQTINLGTTANDGTGDTLRAGGTKINANFTELYALIAASGGTWKLPARAATTANGTLATAFANGQVVDGVTLATGDRILLKNQTTASENGIYVVAASGAPARASDADAGAELVNAALLVSEGTTNADKLFVCTTNAPITVGTTGLTFVNPFGGLGGGDMLAANNLSDLASAATARTNLALLRVVSFFFTTTPTASEVLCLYIAADAFTLPANLSGSQVSVGTNATATFALDLQKNGATIGTISIATSGTATLTTTSGTSKSIAAGDVLKVVAPGTADATIANVAITLKGTL